MTKWFVLSIALLAGCPNDDDGLTPRQACEDASVTLCERVYACLSPSELAAAGFPSSEAACVVNLEQKEGCAAQTLDNACDGNETFHPRNASACVDQLEGMTCSQLRAGQIKTAAPACDMVCEID